MKTPLEQAIEKAGSATKLAKLLKITDSALSQWSRVPVERVLKVEKLTGVSRYKLRPDIYGRQP